jgi:hypothetical protein
LSKKLKSLEDDENISESSYPYVNINGLIDTVFEDEHPLAEREAENGLRNLIIYHTAGQQITPLKELTQDIVGDMYTITKIELPEAKTWQIHTMKPSK